MVEASERWSEWSAQLAPATPYTPLVTGESDFFSKRLGFDQRREKAEIQSPKTPDTQSTFDDVSPFD